MLTAEQMQILRHAVRRYLAERSVTALMPAAICRMMQARQYVDFPITVEDVQAACTFLCRLAPAQATEIPDSLGGSRAYQITSEGVLSHERER